MKGIMLLAAVVCFVVPSAALSRTWYIKPDGTGDAPTIQAGVDSTASGDTVLVASGDYYENVLMKGGITLASVAGWGATSIEPAALLTPIITCTDSVPGAVVMGFTLKGGRAPFGGRSTGQVLLCQLPRIDSWIIAVPTMAGRYSAAM